MTDVPEPGIIHDTSLGLPGPAEPLPEHEPDEPTSDDYEEEAERDG